MTIKTILTSATILTMSTTTLMAQKDPYAKISPFVEKMEILPFGAVTPTGWIKSQIEHNLDGFTGHLDSLVPELIIQDDIYINNRLSKKVKSKDVGALGNEGDWQVQFLWWNSETQSNWRDGYIRSAILANDTDHLKKIDTYIKRMLASQDADGYLGIYDPELRYNFDNENGELWAQASLLRGLLAWYAHTKDPALLAAIKKSADNTMKGFPINKSKPFYSKNPNVGGLSHGLTYTDVLEELYRITKDRKYTNYALFLYKDFSSQVLNEDAQYAKLLKKDLMLTGHGVHTYEHLRSLAAAVYASGNPELQQALKDFMLKINETTTASGGPVGDEWIAGRKADATTRGYEYCSTHELLHSYASLLAKSADSDYGDKVENIFFNAAQGARNPESSSIAYLKSDNSYAMTGGLNGDESDEKQTRYRYSPVHKEAAVCCVPNAGRIAPYYVNYMWLKEKDALVAALLGPSELTTTINGKPVGIREITDYPYDNKLTFEVTANSTFNLKIRKPEWATTFKMNMPYKEANGYIVVSKKWHGVETVTLEFDQEVVVEQDLNGEYYFRYGGLVLAHPLASDATITKQYSLSGFADVEYRPKDLTIYEYAGSSKIKNLGNLTFETELFNPKTDKNETVTLKPIGKTILRQTTFKKHQP